MSSFSPTGMGWLPDLPDARDRTFMHPTVRRLITSLDGYAGLQLPGEIDLRSDDEGVYFGTVEDQGSLDCSPVFAVLSLIEYFERKIHGRQFHGSRLFLHKVTRNLLRRPNSSPGNTHSGMDLGVDLRSTFKALTIFGVPPSRYWPYSSENVDREPSQFLYGLASQPSDLIYFRLDARNQSGSETWGILTSFLTAGFPVAFGFSMPSSVTEKPEIYYRGEFEAAAGGHAVVAVGFELHRFGTGQHALLIRNSWGRDWGDGGYGWLPSAFVANQLARDFWTCIDASWFLNDEMGAIPIAGELSCPDVVAEQDQ